MNSLDTDPDWRRWAAVERAAGRNPGMTDAEHAEFDAMIEQARGGRTAAEIAAAGPPPIPDFPTTRRTRR